VIRALIAAMKEAVSRWKRRRELRIRRASLPDPFN
jgi:hypothetical protein